LNNPAMWEFPHVWCQTQGKRLKNCHNREEL
jgi:hypothetical protein